MNHGTLAAVTIVLLAGPALAAPADETAMREYCVKCHGASKAKGGVNLEAMLSAAVAPTAEYFEGWQTVLEVLEAGEMPPEEEAQPSAQQRADMVIGIKHALARATQANRGDPGAVTLRRLTNSEYRHTIHDLSGVDLLEGTHVVDDAVGGEGFTNVGDVQFMEANILDRYIDLAADVASHAVVGAGPIRFSETPQEKDGWERTAIARIREINQAHGFSPGSGEGGEAFGEDRYVDAFVVAWAHRYRRELGRPGVSLRTLARESGVNPEFASYIARLLTDPAPSFPVSEVIRRWKAIPPPGGLAGDHRQAVRRECRAVDGILRDWYARLASPIESGEDQAKTIAVMEVSEVKLGTSGQLQTRWGSNKTTTSATLEISVAGLDNGEGPGQGRVVWRRPRVRFNREFVPAPNDIGGEVFELRDVLTETGLAKLRNLALPAGESGDPESLVVTAGTSLALDVAFPFPASTASFSADIELHATSHRARVAKPAVAWITSDGKRFEDHRVLADPASRAVAKWKTGIAFFKAHLPQRSHSPTVPSDRDSIPAPFDATYGSNDRYDFHYRIRYNRDDAFLVQHLLEPESRRELDAAWADLYAAHGYHDVLLAFFASKYKLQVPPGTRAFELDDQWVNRAPPEARSGLRGIREGARWTRRQISAAEVGHLDDVLHFAARAWRGELRKEDERRLLDHYRRLIKADGRQHADALRGVLARILVSPRFLFRVETRIAGADPRPVSPPELATRLSYFLWSSMPDESLWQAARTGALFEPRTLAAQVRRMLADPRARRLADDFFGQWLTFARFDKHTATDTRRFPEFTDELKHLMLREAVAFFEHIINADRPVREIFFANYSFVNARLADHYGIKADRELGEPLIKIDNVGRFNRGGVLGLGAILTKTSAPLRTSIVKRGDWVLSRLLGARIPPPPPDAGILPEDDVATDGLTLRQRLVAHRTRSECKNCHARIDPMGFALENFDPIGRWRVTYRDGNPVDASSTTRDGAHFSGFEGLRGHLETKEDRLLETFAAKLLAYALGRGLVPSDHELVDEIASMLHRDKGRFSDAVISVVTSRQFQSRRGDIDGDRLHASN